MTRWVGCGDLDVIQLHGESKVPLLDGIMYETTVPNRMVRLRPPPFGAFVLVSGTGGMKTVQVWEVWLARPVRGSVVVRELLALAHQTLRAHEERAVDMVGLAVAIGELDVLACTPQLLDGVAVVDQVPARHVVAL